MVFVYCNKLDVLELPENNILSTQGLTKDLDEERGGGVLPILTNTGMLSGFDLPF